MRRRRVLEGRDPKPRCRRDRRSRNRHGSPPRPGRPPGGRARQRYLEDAAAAERKPLDDALRAVDESAAAEQRQAEKRMLQELAEQEAAEREAQAAAIARALRRP